jgi:hypothetical protein
LNPNNTIDFYRTKKGKKLNLCQISNTNQLYSVSIHDNNNDEYIGEINYHLTQFAIETTNLPFKKIEFLNCDSNEVYIVPVSKKLNTSEKQEIFTQIPNNFEFSVTDVTEFDVQQVKCYTYKWDYLMNDELWNNSSNVDLNQVDLQQLEIGIRQSYFDLNLNPIGSIQYNANIDNLKKKAYFGVADKNDPNMLLPYGLNFDKSEYLTATSSHQQKEYLRKEIIFKNEVYDSVMKMKQHVSNDLGILWRQRSIENVPIDPYATDYYEYVYRGMTRPFDLTRPGTVLVTGGGFVNKGFMSTTINIDIADKFVCCAEDGKPGVIYEFKVMPGVPYISYDLDPFDSLFQSAEDEVLIGKNVIIHVDSSPSWDYFKTPVIKGTISYDVNDVIAKQRKHAVLTTVHSMNSLDFRNYIKPNILNCRWSILPSTKIGGRNKQTKRRKYKKTRKQKRRNNKKDDINFLTFI